MAYLKKLWQGWRARTVHMEDFENFLYTITTVLLGLLVIRMLVAWYMGRCNLFLGI